MEYIQKEITKFKKKTATEDSETMKYNKTTDRSSQTYSRSTERMNTCGIGGKGERVDESTGLMA